MDSHSLFENCTITDNHGAENGAALRVIDCDVIITNSIIWGNHPDQIWTDSGNVPVIVYSNIQGGWPGLGNIDADPLFFEPGYWIEPDILWVDGDYHLKSTGGRYWPMLDIWAIDEVHSPCIDVGDPASSVGNEPVPNGGRINQGAYGGTNQASESPTE